MGLITPSISVVVITLNTKVKLHVEQLCTDFLSKGSILSVRQFYSCLFHLESFRIMRAKWQFLQSMSYFENTCEIRNTCKEFSRNFFMTQKVFLLFSTYWYLLPETSRTFRVGRLNNKSNFRSFGVFETPQIRV